MAAGDRAQLPNEKNPYQTNAVDDASFTKAAETANMIAVTIQAKARKRVIAKRVWLNVWLSDAATGVGLVATAPDGGVAAGASGNIQNAFVASKMFKCLTDATGKLILNITHAAGAKTLYVGVEMPDGTIVVSTAVTFA